MASPECASDGLELDDSPPSDGLASYDLFVKWVLSSPTATVDEAAPAQWPSDFESLDTETTCPAAAAAPTSFASVTQAKWARATVESDHEALADELFTYERECQALADAIHALEAEKANDQQQVEALERLILERLQERDDTVTDQFTLEQQISILQQKAPPPGKALFAPPWPKLATLKFSAKEKLRRAIQSHEKQLAHEKLSLAEAKADVDMQSFTNRLLEKKCADLRRHLATLQMQEKQAKQALDQVQTTFHVMASKLHLVPHAASKV
ncbi:unnamed protein product [Aphanomyces euteiches]|uniref:Uncharacterized protein n=1 Tax=Aphanomyces euteiches TaxID=100861 RepID=A0A6G0X5X0_9STRA|nr:hypothetical protein Ae201684_008085 [Aphanomyces euteiches]KAH9156004.1 hypothetical protein AeRB84_002068 [Aphanomyces euteiches]